MILLWCAAGPVVGLGHLSRCHTLATSLIQRGADVRLLVEATGDYGVHTAGPALETLQVKSRLEAWEAVSQIRPRCVITDLLGLSANDSARLRDLGCQKLVHINDSGIGDFLPDLVVDTDVVPTVTVASAGCMVLAGANWHMVRPDVQALRPPEPWAGGRAARILLSFGGADPGEVSETVAASWPADLSGSLVLGGAVSPERRLAFARPVPGLTVLNAPVDLPRLILDHDLVVTLGGLTSYEAMTLGRPVACVAWAHMAPYVSSMVGAGVALGLGAAHLAAAALRRGAEQGEILTAVARRGWSLVDGGGRQRVAEAILLLDHGA